MSEENKVIEQVVEEVATTVEAKNETPIQDASYKEVKKDGTIKLDVSKLKKFQNQDEEKQEEVQVSDEEKLEQEVDEESVLQEVTEVTEATEAQDEQALVVEESSVENSEKPEQALKQDLNLPENIQSLVKFMEETGGSMEDYIRLNADYSTVDNNTLIKEYYKSTKSHLDSEEIDFLIEDKFSYDEDLDEDRDIRKRKLALKEEVAKAKNFLTGLKDKYYEEVKLGSKLTREQQEAINFYSEYNKEQSTAGEVQQKQYKQFQQSTNNVFNEEFKGFDFNVGDKKYRYNVKDASNVKDYQSDISNFVKEFLDENDMMKDAKGYHKALYAGKNIDKIVSHFYEQGKADAIKQTTMNAKNIDMSARTIKPVVDASGIKVRVLGGEDSSKLKFKIKK
tara:strand:+ start:3708 stop:4889 length:1182 start_codon:yes stop_codon:yes gene_type:complete